MEGGVLSRLKYRIWHPSSMRQQWEWRIEEGDHVPLGQFGKGVFGLSADLAVVPTSSEHTQKNR